ncbi:MAG: T9SS type A sorting domain-containing protein [Candidatus Poribacteria bacterium]|nr:T9SS type A sorting domain-containing protein [Candidatus Poribacteria bacterium]
MEKVFKELDIDGGIPLIATNMDIDRSTCGIGNPFEHLPFFIHPFNPKWNRSWAIFQFPQIQRLQTPDCSVLDLGWLIAHELGHAFGLKHDFRTGNNIMSYNFKKLSAQTLSRCAAEWLKVCRAFNADTLGFSAGPIKISNSTYSLKATDLEFSFELNNLVGGIHSAQLHVVPTTVPRGFYPPTGQLSLSSRETEWNNLDVSDRVTLSKCKSVNTNRLGKATVKFVYSDLNSHPITHVSLRAIDDRGKLVDSGLFAVHFPDLAIKSVVANKSSLSPGERFRLDTIVKNQGKTASSETTLKFYRSLDRNLSANDTKLHEVRVKQLNAGKQITPWKRFTAPRAPGVYYYIVCVDDIQSESRTDNNCYKPVKITVATSSPDLVVEPPRVQKTNLEPGERFRFEVIVRNQGTEESEKTYLHYYLSRDANISDTDIRQRTDNVDSLDPNETGKEWATLTAPDTPGTYYFGTCVEDIDDESNTNNNCSDAVRITVQAGQPPGLRIGDAVVAQNTVGNGLSGLLVRKYFGRGSPIKGGVWDGATGIITAGPEKTEDGFTWWEISWNPSDAVRWNDEYAPKCKNKPCEGWSVEIFRGSRVIAKLDLAAPPLELVIPKETTLLSNYPNPFNPETWIPYQLSQSAEVSISIFASDGKLVRTLALGHQSAGVYHSKSRAAYWDGKNEVGEQVASGVYFYTLTAGDITATKKMLILK